MVKRRKVRNGDMRLLNEIQQKLKVPKSQYNSFSKFYYRNAEDILEAVKPLLGGGKLIVSDEVVQIGDRYYVKATATLYGADGSDKSDCAWAVGWAREAVEKKGMDEAQITGAASSYARKYALNGLFLIDDTKDADTEAPESPKTGVGAKKYDYPAQTSKNDASGLPEAPKAVKKGGKIGSEGMKTDVDAIKAAKLRIIDLVDALKGRTEKKLKPPPSLAGKIYSDDVFDLVGMSLATDDLDGIGDALAKLLEDGGKK